MKKLWLSNIIFLPTLFVSSCSSGSNIVLPGPIIPPSKPDEKPDDSKPKPKPGWSYRNNTKAEDVYQYSIEHNKNLHFNYPYYESDLVTLRANGEPIHNIPGPGVPSGPDQYAQEGVITTRKHAQLAKQVFSVGFHNGVEKTGTAWILDYKLTNDGSYPLTWYFGTNAHVLDDLKVMNDKLYPEKFGKWNSQLNSYRTMNTRAVSLWKLNNPRIGKFENDNYSNPEWSETRVEFFDRSKEDKNGKIQNGYYIDKPPIKTIFTGNDFLTTSPSDDSTNSFSNREEYADFGVFELTFENEQQARQATNDYANWKEEDKFKYYKDDLLHNPKLQTEKVYTLGYPQVGGSTDAYRTIAINVNSVEYKEGRDNGNGLSKSQHYNTWTNRYGMYDGHIAMPWFGYKYEWVDNNDNSDQAERTTTYATYGLIYGTNNGNMKGGSSGSLVVDENGYAIGIHFGSDNNAATGSAQAFYSSGFDYKGYYGDYNLPQYDLIRGGFPKQKNSYYDGLVKIYGNDSNFKTRLFPNGLKSRN